MRAHDQMTEKDCFAIHEEGHDPSSTCSFSVHTDVPFALLASKNNINLAVIPGGCTSKVQPLNVSVNKPFKDVARHQLSPIMLRQPRVVI